MEKTKKQKQIRAIDAANGMTYIGEGNTDAHGCRIVNYVVINTRYLYSDLNEGPENAIIRAYKNCPGRGKETTIERTAAVVHAPITIDDTFNSDKQ